jgi:glycosyltransferase involved in cell wall biosynthesis
MEITVCICTHNRPRYVRDCLEGLRRQTEPADRFAVLVIDSGSTGRAQQELAELVAQFSGARLIRVDAPGVSIARNAAAWAARTPYVAYIDDDAIPAPDWIANIHRTVQQGPCRPALIGGRILPKWEAPLPAWWPASLRGVLSIIEAEGQGEYRTADLPPGLEPYGANMTVHVLSLLAIGGFGTEAGRYGRSLLSDEEVQIAWKLQDGGHSVRYDSRIVVQHQIQASRLTPEWLLARLYWQGASTVLTRRMLGAPRSVWRELPRRVVVALLCAPFYLMPTRSTHCIAARWRLAYAAGFLRTALGWQPRKAATRRDAAIPVLGTSSVVASDPA